MAKIYYAQKHWQNHEWTVLLSLLLILCDGWLEIGQILS